jgi:hypothetical protein
MLDTSPWKGVRYRTMLATCLAVVVDGHSQVVLAVGHFRVERDVLNLNVAKLLDSVGDAAQWGSDITLAATSGIRLAEMPDRPVAY